MTDFDDVTELRGRMRHAVGDLHAPDLAATAMSEGRRHRARRATTYAAGGVAALAVIGAVGYPLAQGASTGSAGDGEPQGYATAPSSPRDPGRSPGGSGTPGAGCPDPGAGPWNMPAAEIRDHLAAALPAGTTIGEVEDTAPGHLAVNLVQDGDRDFAMVTLLPPAAVDDEPRSREGGVLLCRTTDPMQDPARCEPGIGCEEVRDDAGEVVGVVSERVESDIENGQEVPTDRQYRLATLRLPDGGHVEIYVSEGTRDDRPSTVHDPSDEPALTMDQLAELVQAPAWTG